MFPRFNDRHTQLAEEAMLAARRGRFAVPAVDRDGFPKQAVVRDLDLVAAGVAIALVGPESRSARNEETLSVLNPSGIPGGKLRSALARICADQNAENFPSKQIPQVLEDVCQQISATKIVAAIRNPAFDQALNASQRELAGMGRRNEALALDMVKLMNGDFAGLSKDMAGEVGNAIETKMPDQNVVMIGSIAQQVSDRRAVEMDREFEPYTPVEKSDKDKVSQFFSQGKSTGKAAMDACLRVVQPDNGMSTNASEDNERLLVCAARMLPKLSSDTISSAFGACMMKSEMKVMREAEERLYASPRPTALDQHIASGEFDKLSLKEQQGLSQSIRTAARVSGVDMLRTSIAVFDQERERRAVFMQRASGMER